MAQILTFYDKNHQYTLDGEGIPSVSEISRFASREIYQTVEQYRLDKAAERGSKVHKACEMLDLYGTCEVTEDIAGYVKAYMRFRAEHPIKYEFIEKAFASSEGLKFAGTLDRVGTFDTGEKVIIDIKTSATIQKALAQIQLGAYRSLYEKNTGQSIDKLYILHLKADETYKLVEFAKDSTLFDACITLHYALKKKKRSNKKEQDSNDGKQHDDRD